ncbi:hypothetical protein ACFW04_012191 [Cataglyphis niger]
MISEFVEKDHRDWDEHLPALQFAYNTAVHDATGYTPAYLNHGRELTPPHHVPSTTTSIPPDTTRRRLDEAYEIVRIQLARAFQRQEKYYNLRRRQWKPKSESGYGKRITRYQERPRVLTQNSRQNISGRLKYEG